MKSIKNELKDINKIMNKFGFFTRIQKETVKISSSATVTDGKHEDVDFDIVIKCASKDYNSIHRRLSSLPDIITEKIAENILGIKERRNGK